MFDLGGGRCTAAFFIRPLDFFFFWYKIHINAENRSSRHLKTFREEPVGERLWHWDSEPVWEQQEGKPFSETPDGGHRNHRQ